jgi:hypothetical protein
MYVVYFLKRKSNSAKGIGSTRLVQKMFNSKTEVTCKQNRACVNGMNEIILFAC